MELYILITENAPFKQREFQINDECTYVMHVISLKDIRADDIFEKIENKMKNKEKISEEDIASLQLIVYTDYEESPLEILKKASGLVEKLDIDENEKEAIFYIFNVLSTNMLSKKDQKKLMEETNMMLNPRDEYFKNLGIEKGKLEIAMKLLEKGNTIEEIAKITGLTPQQIQNAK